MAPRALSKTLQQQTEKFFTSLEAKPPEKTALAFTPLFEALKVLNAKTEHSNKYKLIEQYHIQMLEEWLQHEEIISKTSSWKAKLKLGLLMIAGTLYFGCEGFDGALAMLGIFSLPASALLIGGVSFSLLYILVFYSFELVEVASNLGIEKAEASDLVNLCMHELKLLKGARDKIFLGCDEASEEELQEYLLLCTVLQQRYQALMTLQNKLSKALDNPILNATKHIFSIVVGLLFFSGGFFAGQTVALCLLPLVIGTSAAVTATFWPILVASLLMGLCAASIYWFVERPSIEVYVSQKFGLDKDLITEFTAKDLEDKILRCQTLSTRIESQLPSLDNTHHRLFTAPKERKQGKNDQACADACEEPAPAG